jgi:hypothetical protein
MSADKPLKTKMAVFKAMMEQEGSCKDISCAGNPLTGRNTVMCPFYILKNGRLSCEFDNENMDRTMRFIFLEKIIHGADNE